MVSIVSNNIKRLEVLLRLVRSTLIPIAFPDSLEDPTSTSKRERTLSLEVVSTPRREDITGPPRLRGETLLALVAADILDTSTDVRRTAGDPDARLKRRSRPTPLPEQFQVGSKYSTREMKSNNSKRSAQRDIHDSA